MRGVLLASSIAVFVLLSHVSYAEQDSEIIQITQEIVDAPDSIWGEDSPDHGWQVIFVGFQVNGGFSENDSVDIFALKISSSNGTRVEIVSSSEGSIQIQSLNQTSWKIEESVSIQKSNDSENGKSGEMNLSMGYHAVRVENQGDSGQEVNYSFRLIDKGPALDERQEFEDLSWMFMNFYIFAGVFLLLPFLTVLWWNRNQWLAEKESSGIDNQEIGVLASLRKRFEDEEGALVDKGLIERSLKNLGDDSWEYFVREFGIPKINYKTDNSETLIWTTSVLGEFGIGIKVSGKRWDMAAIRAYSPHGERVEISSVEPEHMFQNDEVFLNSLEPDEENFLRIIILGSVKEIRFHLSGIVDGIPVASSPNDSIKQIEEE